jgi:hypothetical protein
MATTRVFVILFASALSGCVAIGDGAKAPERAEYQESAKGRGPQLFI